MTRRYFYPAILLISGVMLCVTARPGLSTEIGAFSNRPTIEVFTPNDKTAENRKQAALQNWRRLQQSFRAGLLTKEEYQRARPDLGRVVDALREDESISPAPRPPYKVLNVNAEQQVCKEYCAPASTRAMLVFSGNPSLSQGQIAELLGTGACTPISSKSSGNAGTCLAPIRDVLNRYYRNPPSANYFVTYRLDHSSLSAAFNDYSALVDTAIYAMGTPFVQLLNPRLCEMEKSLPGWDALKGCVNRHYVVTRGYDGFYNGTQGSRVVSYAESAWWTWGNKWVDLQLIARAVYSADGDGACDFAGLTNIVW